MKKEVNEKTMNFGLLKIAFEKAFIDNPSGEKCGEACMNLSRSIAHSVLNSVLDPKRRGEKEKVSDSACNPHILEIKRGISSDTKALESVPNLTEEEFTFTFNKEGDLVKVNDKAITSALHNRLNTNLSEGMNIVNSACLALLEVSAKHCKGNIGFLDEKYTERKLDKRVVIRKADSAKWEDVETTPIQEVYRSVRRVIAQERSVKFNPKSGYLYIEDICADKESGKEEEVYKRAPRHYDLGSYEISSGMYTGNASMIGNVESFISSLDLTQSQAVVLHLRMQGKGVKAIASYLGVDPKAIKNTLGRIQKKAIKNGIAVPNEIC